MTKVEGANKVFLFPEEDANLLRCPRCGGGDGTAACNWSREPVGIRRLDGSSWSHVDDESNHPVWRYCRVCKDWTAWFDGIEAGVCMQYKYEYCDGIRYYAFEDGSKLVGVTSILRALPEPMGLTLWKARNPRSVLIAQDAATRGTLLHYRIGTFLAKQSGLPMPPLELKPGTPPPDAEMVAFVQRAWGQFEDWWKTYQPKPLAVEVTVRNFALGYAGTIDFLCTIDGKVWLLDWKTGKSVYEKYRAQLWAYKAALEEMATKPAARYPAPENLGVLRFDPRPGEDYEFADIGDGDGDLFLQALENFHKNNPKTVDQRKA